MKEEAIGLLEGSPVGRPWKCQMERKGHVGIGWLTGPWAQRVLGGLVREGVLEVHLSILWISGTSFTSTLLQSTGIALIKFPWTEESVDLTLALSFPMGATSQSLGSFSGNCGQERRGPWPAAHMRGHWYKHLWVLESWVCGESCRGSVRNGYIYGC